MISENKESRANRARDANNVKTFWWLAFATHRTVNEHPYQPHQRRDTDNAVHDAAGDTAGAEQPRNQVKTKDANQSPVQGTDYRQWYKNIAC